MTSFRSLARRLLRLPLLYKILVANSAIVALGAVAGTAITVWHVTTFADDPHSELIAYFLLAGFAVSFAVNWLVLRLALAPLDRLQRAVDQVRAGQWEVRADPGSLADARFERLASTLNQMLEAKEQDARRLHELSQDILQAQEEERRRLARELHDEAGQALTSLLVRLRLLERSDSPEQARTHVHELRKMTAQALEEVRHIALELRPSILDDLGLGAALAWRVDELNAARTVHATLQVVGVEQRLPRPLELVFYRVGQEALTNIARYARAQHAALVLRREGDWLSLEIKDDGVGFDPAAVQARPSRGLGLLGMRERLALVQGELEIQSTPGRGTRILARAPIRPEAKDLE